MFLGIPIVYDESLLPSNITFSIANDGVATSFSFRNRLEGPEAFFCDSQYIPLLGCTPSDKGQICISESPYLRSTIFEVETCPDQH